MTERGEVNFWYQLMNKPHAREDRPITEEHIERLWIESIDDIPSRAFNNVVIACDFAFKREEDALKGKGDWGVAHVGAIYNGYVYRLGGVRAKATQEEFGEMLVGLVEWVKYEFNGKVRKITYELQTGHGSGDESTRMWLSQLFNKHRDLGRIKPWPISRIRGKNRSKWQRIRNTSWAWQEGYVVLCKEAEGNDPLIYQMLNQNVARHDDDADAFADFFHESVYKKSQPGEINFDDEEEMNERWVPEPAVHGAYSWADRSYRFSGPTQRTDTAPTRRF
jgi:phage terminase large subunit-like protein